MPVSNCDQPTEDELGEFLSQSFAKWCLPDRDLMIVDVPKTSVGKYDKKRLRAMVADGGIDNVTAQIGINA